MRLIDLDSEYIQETLYRRSFKTRQDIEEWLNNAPIIDAVPVVRCRDCQRWKPSGSKAGNSFLDMEYIGGCKFSNYYRRESDFCNYGEPKET